MGIFTRLSGTNKQEEPKAQPEVKTVEKLTPTVLGAAFLDSNVTAMDDKSVSPHYLGAFKDWVYANASVIAEAVSEIKFELYRVQITRGDVVFEPVLDDPVLDLLDRFNPFMTKSDAIYTTQTHIDLAGDTFYLLDGAGKDVTVGTNIENIFILQPDKITVEPGGKGEPLIKAYKYKDVVDGQQVDITYEPEEIVQIKYPNPSNPLRGKSVVEAANVTIDINNLMGEFNKSFFRNGAIISYILSTEKSVTKDDLARLEADMKRNYSGFRNAFKTMILTGGLEPKQIQSTNRDMEMLELQKWIRDKIMAMFKNTKTSLGITDDVNRANAEASMIAWKQNVIKPKMKRICDTLNEFLVPRFGENLILTYADPVPENREAKIVEAKDLVGKVMTVNEARQLLGLDELEGDEFDSLNTGGNQPQAPAAGTTPEKAYKAKSRNSEMPASLNNIDLTKVLRKRGIYRKARIARRSWEASKEVAEGYIKAKRKVKSVPKPTTPDPVLSPFFTNKQVWDYWQKQVDIVPIIEERFNNTVVKYISNLETKAIARLHAVRPKSVKKDYDLYDREAEVKVAIDMFTPLMNEIMDMAGDQTYDLLKIGAGYELTQKAKNQIRAQIEKFAASMIDTDKDKLSKILAEGFGQGESIAQIERKVRDEFANISKVQSTRVTRTEILRTSNMGALDAFEASGLVEAKQWLTAPSPDSCEALNGKIVGLSRTFVRRGQTVGSIKVDYENIQAPPLHPNCRCVIIPVLREEKAIADEHRKEMEAKERKIKELEQFNQELEKLVGLNDESTG